MGSDIAWLVLFLISSLITFFMGWVIGVGPSSQKTAEQRQEFVRIFGFDPEKYNIIEHQEKMKGKLKILHDSKQSYELTRAINCVVTFGFAEAITEVIGGLPNLDRHV